MVADMEGCGRISTCLPTGRYDTIKKLIADSYT
jgi:hypothetical protein